jgi:antirestriction protein ArdC
MTNDIIILDDARTRENIVHQLINALEEGPPWDRNVRPPTNPATGWHYTGITFLVLDVISSQHGYRSEYWAKAEDWSKCGGEVCGPGFDVPYEVDDGLRWIRLWHAEDVRGADRFRSVRMLDPSWEKIARLLAATGANVIHEIRPYPIYEPPRPWSAFPDHVEGDVILAPPLELCRGPEHYWHNLAHELFHWAEVRTDWLSHDMPKREFVAEFGGAYMLRWFSLLSDGNHYNFWTWQSDWREAMLTDLDWLFEAVQQAEKALDYLLQFNVHRG